MELLPRTVVHLAKKDNSFVTIVSKFLWLSLKSALRIDGFPWQRLSKAVRAKNQAASEGYLI
jgi:hypothetical protein